MPPNHIAQFLLSLGTLYSLMKRSHQRRPDSRPNLSLTLCALLTQNTVSQSPTESGYNVLLVSKENQATERVPHLTKSDGLKSTPHHNTQENIPERDANIYYKDGLLFLLSFRPVRFAEHFVDPFHGAVTRYLPYQRGNSFRNYSHVVLQH